MGRLILATTVLLTMSLSVRACPTCKDSFMKKDDAGGPAKLNSVGLGFGWSVIFMLAAPASVAGGLVWLVVKNGNSASQGKVS
ncbi:MAG: hypothetical protein EBZ44_05070 [Verrucomicrobia bacterium]|nr:hypothetical protein [Verrucomicrobiota bacterium]